MHFWLWRARGFLRLLRSCSCSSLPPCVLLFIHLHHMIFSQSSIQLSPPFLIPILAFVPATPTYIQHTAFIHTYNCTVIIEPSHFTLLRRIVIFVILVPSAHITKITGPPILPPRRSRPERDALFGKAIHTPTLNNTTPLGVLLTLTPPLLHFRHFGRPVCLCLQFCDTRCAIFVILVHRRGCRQPVDIFRTLQQLVPPLLPSHPSCSSRNALIDITKRILLVLYNRPAPRHRGAISLAPSRSTAPFNNHRPSAKYTTCVPIR